MHRYLKSLLAVIVLCFSGISTNANAASDVVHVYSAQKEHLIRPVLDLFTEQSGTEVKLLTGDNAALVTRLEHEGEKTPADLLLTVDIGNLYQAKIRSLLQSIESDVLEKNIPAHLRDSEGEWFGLTTRARVLFALEGAKEKAPKNYMALAAPTLKDTVLIRSSNNVYNQSLMSYMIHHYGQDKALTWARGIVANMARPPQGGDRDQIRALAAGEGRVAVANTYYYGLLVAGDETMQDVRVQERVAIIFPDTSDKGVHINIRGGGVTRHADNRDGAIALLEFLSGEEAQRIFADANFEYPANPAVDPSDALAQWGTFTPDTTPLETIGALQSVAIRLMDEAGWK